MDGVFNHTGREFFAFRDLQAHRDQSPYAGWYRNVNFGWGSPLGDSFGYESWHGIWELPCLNHGNPEVRNYLLDTVRFWVQEFDIDGIRLDCAGDLSFEFMQELRRLANEIKPEFWLMGEVIHGEYARWVNPQMLHSVTNYEMHKSIYSAHNDHNYFELAHNVRRLEAVGRDLYTFVDNHDEDRIASKLLNPAHLAPLYTLLFTLPGIPSIYYGSEWGIQGRRGHNSDTELRPRILPPTACRRNADQRRTKHRHPHKWQLPELFERHRHKHTRRRKHLLPDHFKHHRLKHRYQRRHRDTAYTSDPETRRHPRRRTGASRWALSGTSADKPAVRICQTR